MTSAMASGSNVCFSFFKSKYVNIFLQVVWLSNIVFIAVSPDMNRLVFRQILQMSVLEQLSLGFNVFCVFLLSLEILSGIVAIGLKRWLVISVYHRLDLAIFLVCVLEGVGGVFALQLPTLRPFRILRVFKNISTFKILAGFDIILETLERCSGQIATIALICLSLFSHVCDVGTPSAVMLLGLQHCMEQHLHVKGLRQSAVGPR